MKQILLASDDVLRAKFRALAADSDVADLLEVPAAQLRYILYHGRRAYPYRTFHIAKRSGGTRMIAAPPPSLRILQRKLHHVLSLVVSARPTAHGFVRGRGIVTNARLHVGRTQVLNVDIADFFGAIHFGRVFGVLRSSPFGIQAAAAAVIAQLCTFDGMYPGGIKGAASTDSGARLPQGAPTSPIISNMVSRRLDRELFELAREHGWNYSRYADDITFSTMSRFLPGELAERVGGSLAKVEAGAVLSSIFERNGFRLNPDKTRLHTRKQRQLVTGLVVNRATNVPRSFVRNTRAMINDARIRGVIDAEERMRSLYGRSKDPSSGSPSFEEVLRGRLSYIEMVKGGNDPVLNNLASQALLVFPKFSYQTRISTPHSAFGTNNTWSEWKTRYESSILQIDVFRDGNQTCGTVFVVDNQHVATAAHVLSRQNGSPAPEDEIDLSPLISKSRISAHEAIIHSGYEGARKSPDVAVLTVSGGVGRRAALPIRRYPLKIGEEVAALGFPAIPGRNPTLAIHLGIVEALTKGYNGLDEYIQVSFQVGGGLSGGPLIDRQGFVVGIIGEIAVLQSRLTNGDANEAARYRDPLDPTGAPRQYGSATPVCHLLELPVVSWTGDPRQLGKANSRSVRRSRV